jgi:hypothetical protein
MAPLVTPAQAGVQLTLLEVSEQRWIPAFAGMMTRLRGDGPLAGGCPYEAKPMRTIRFSDSMPCHSSTES